MKVFANLELSGDAEQLALAVAQIETALSHGWERSRELERRVSDPDARCFHCMETDTHPAAGLWLMPGREPTKWYVSNIVPTQKSSLSHDQYNAILREFHDRFAEPVSRRLGLVVTLGKFEESVEDWMSHDAVEALEYFSVAANKSTGSSHPSDRERWLDFILKVHRSARGPDSTTLRRWLIEHEQWSADVATDLAIEYEFGLALLRHADRM